MIGCSMAESSYVFALLVVLVLFLLMNWRVTAVERRIAKISRVDVKLDLLLKHAGIEYDPFKALPRDVAEALRNRQKIHAIKLYRNATGVAMQRTSSRKRNVAPVMHDAAMLPKPLSLP